MKRNDDGSIEIRRPDDFHVHLRDGELMRHVLPFTAKVFKRALIMPNLRPTPVTSARDAQDYRYRIITECARLELPKDFEPLMTFQITDRTAPSAIAEAAELKQVVFAAKVYPVGATTNSDNGVTDFRKLDAVWAMMEHVGMVLCLHCEDPTAETLDREHAFMETLQWLCGRYPKLRIVVEHVSKAEMVEMVKTLPKNVGATVTLHHLLLTFDDWVGPPLRPHNYCRPPPQWKKDRQAIKEVVLAGNPKFFFGSDSAPHVTGAKECAACAAGVFTGPVLLPLLAEFFEDHDALNQFEPFVAAFGARHYGLDLNPGTVRLEKGEYFIPHEYKPESIDKAMRLTPFRAGEKIRWHVA